MVILHIGLIPHGPTLREITNLNAVAQAMTEEKKAGEAVSAGIRGAR